MAFDQTHGRCWIACGSGMVDRLIDQSVRFVPACRSSMKVAHELPRVSVQPGAKQFGEEVVIAPPAAFVVERDNEKIRSFARFE